MERNWAAKDLKGPNWGKLACPAQEPGWGWSCSWWGEAQPQHRSFTGHCPVLRGQTWKVAIRRRKENDWGRGKPQSSVPEVLPASFSPQSTYDLQRLPVKLPLQGPSRALLQTFKDAFSLIPGLLRFFWNTSHDTRALCNALQPWCCISMVTLPNFQICIPSRAGLQTHIIIFNLNECVPELTLFHKTA